ncbi:hypothetical protein RHSIM_Rhsim11G0142900 [Rhododendron simsii]|uniref:Legume lectin domain-containing protein n=1 Tax=Rhododendron simsii TaxID=118357 RepID=A0A834G7N4_RHOSS|nr:hypothetical protein RHSIM_Rhsim11G0142900 [Rhododendron simsii]
MAIFNFQILLYSLSMFFFCILFPQTNSLTFNLTNFNDPDQKVNIILTPTSEAHISTQGLQITTTERVNGVLNVGKATYIESLHLWDKSTQKLANFNTHFVFVIDSQESLKFADGFTFFLAPDEWNSTGGGAMGLPIDTPFSTTPTSRFVAVEFDTYGNPWDRFNTTHVGIDVNSIISDVTAAWYCNITHGIQNEAWIRYDSSSHNLSVVFTGSTNTTRVDDTIHFIVDLRKHLPERVTIGFSAATAAGNFETHTVKSWEFSSSFAINETNNTVTVKPGSNKISLGAVVGSVVGSGVFVGGFVLVGFGLWRRSRAKEEDEFEIEMSLENEFEAGAGPKKFSYQSQMRLVEWVWDLYGMGRLLEAVDAKLGSDFDEQETERLMIVGLWCAHPDHNFRPKIRDAIHVLINFEAPLPILPPKPPALSFSSPPLHTDTTSSDTNQNQFSGNVDSSKFISSSTASSSSIKVFNKE